MKELFKEVWDFQKNNYPCDHREILAVRLNSYVNSEQLRDMYNLYGITYEEYLNDLSNSYLRYRSQRISEEWQKQGLTN